MTQISVEKITNYVADPTPLYSSPELRAYLKRISWYLESRDYRYSQLHELCPNGKCLEVTLLFGSMAWRCSEWPNCIKHVLRTRFFVDQSLLSFKFYLTPSNVVKQGVQAAKRWEANSLISFIAKHFLFKLGFMLWSFGFVKPG